MYLTNRHIKSVMSYYTDDDKNIYKYLITHFNIIYYPWHNKPYSTTTWIYLQVTVRNAEIQKARFSKGTKVKFKIYNENQYHETKMVKNTLSPEYNFSYIHSFPAIVKEHLEFFEAGCITFLLYGHQEDATTDKRLAKMTTKVGGVLFINFF